MTNQPDSFWPLGYRHLPTYSTVGAGMELCCRWCQMPLSRNFAWFDSKPFHPWCLQSVAADLRRRADEAERAAHGGWGTTEP